MFYEPPEPGVYCDCDILVVGATKEALVTALGLSSYNRVTLAHSASALTDIDRDLTWAAEAQVREGKLNMIVNARVKQVEVGAVVVETPSAVI